MYKITSLRLKVLLKIRRIYQFMKTTTNQTIQHTTKNLQDRCLSLETEVAELKKQIKRYEEMLRLSQHKRFGSSSEKSHPGQLELPLFNEAEVEATFEKGEPVSETITYNRMKTRGKREALLENLPMETVEYRLSPEEQVCLCCGGQMHEMSTEERHEIKMIPAQVKVVKHIRFVYACRSCERSEIETPIITAPMPKSVFPGSMASPSSMAYVMTQKYVEACPLYRLESQMERLGFSLSRQTMSNWILYGANTWLLPIFNRMKTILLLQGAIHADETTLQVLHEPGRKASSKSYIWLYRSGRLGPPIVLYDYKESRSKENPRQFLKGFEGYLHVDGYAGYNGLANVTLVGCWAHARRKFDEVLKSLPPGKSSQPTLAKEGLDFCNQLFAIERDLKDVTREERYQERLKRSQPILDAFSVWLKTQRSKVLPRSAFGEAINYCINQWDKLIAFMKDGILEIDNNRSERSIKPFVIGRKNWIFSNTPKGANASAIVYSLVETAKENGLNPLNYLTYLFEKLPNIDITDSKSLDPFLPWSSSLPLICRNFKK